MIFDYLDGEPIIPLKIWSKNNTWVEFQAYADSGAGYSVFHQDTAMILGINYRQGSLLKLTVGNGDKLPVYLHRAKVNFANKEFYAQIAFSKNLVVGVNLLGQKSFFDRFTFCFQSWKKQLEVIPKPGW